jgi:predicted O-methyltransferase YrrM
MFDLTKPDFQAEPHDAAELSFLVPYYRAQPCYRELCNLNQTASMLHPDVLALLFHLGAFAGGVLEIGPYIGGSTIAVCWGKESSQCRNRVVAIELGGTYSHPTLATDDIVRDLRVNLKRYGVEARVDLIVGSSRDPEVIRQVERIVGGQPFGLMMVDADGLIELDFVAYRHLLRRGTYLVVDDYFSPWAPEKVGPTRSGLLTLMKDDLIECLGVYGWGTWFGRVK